MRRVRSAISVTNVKLMVPLCRRVDEAHRVERMAEHGLERGQDGLQICVMWEIANNVLSIDGVSEMFERFAIGSNDLTQLVLCADRGSGIVAFDYDERDAGGLEMVRMAIEGGRRDGRHCGIFGKAPSDYPEMAALLVCAGICSICLTPDTVIATTRASLQLEHALARAPRPDRLLTTLRAIIFAP